MKFGTAIVVARTPDQIILGADGKQISSEVDGTSAEPVSKISQVRDDLFFTLAGLVGSDEAKFDAATLVDRACREGASPEEILRKLDTLIEGPLTSAVEYIRRDKPVDFDNFLRGKRALEVIVTGRAGGELFIVRRAFVTKLRGKDVKLMSQGDIIPNASNNRFAMVSNCSHQIDEQLRKRLTLAQAEADPELAVRTTLEVAIEIEPDHVGPPIRMLRLTKDGYEWLR